MPLGLSLGHLLGAFNGAGLSRDAEIRYRHRMKDGGLRSLGLGTAALLAQVPVRPKAS